MVDQDNEGLWLDELVHHLLKHEVRQQKQDAPQEIIESTADQHQAVLSAGPGKHSLAYQCSQNFKKAYALDSNIISGFSQHF